LRRAAVLLCSGWLAVLLVWRAPSYSEAQSIRKGPKKDAAESTNNVAEAEKDTATSRPPDTNATATADAATPPEAAAGETKEADGGDGEKGKTKDKDKEGKAKGEEKLLSTDEIQLSFQGAHVDMIVQWLAQQTGKSVVKHPRVQCQLTIVGSKKVTRREAINLVYRALALEGFTAIESSKAILIVPEGQEPKMSPELIGATKNDIPEGRQRLMKIFPLSHVQAAELKEKIKGVLSEKGTIDTDDRANQVIVTDYNENLGLVADMIRALDSDKPQDITVRVLPLKNVSAQDLVKEIAPLYQKLSAKAANKEMIEVAANDRSRTLDPAVPHRGAGCCRVLSVASGRRSTGSPLALPAPLRVSRRR